MRIGFRIVSFTLILATTLSMGARAADPANATAEPSAATIDAIVRKLESSGALDAALDRALSRQSQRQQQAAQEAETQKQAQLQGQAKAARAVDAKRDHIRGNASADVSLIEYSDFECPFCKQFHGAPRALLDRYKGRINWVYRNYPLPFHDPAARKEALAAECVAQLGGNDAYWEYADSLFASTKSNGAGMPDDKSIDKLAEAVGVKGASLTKCMSEDAAVKRIEQDIADGNSSGVSGTPTTVVRNNRTGASEAVVGAVPADSLVPAIDRMLTAKP
ncbi:MAG: DsbA family protein [Casimicrobiaceae bacterium]